jgi:hypothetical protein
MNKVLLKSPQQLVLLAIVCCLGSQELAKADGRYIYVEVSWTTAPALVMLPHRGKAYRSLTCCDSGLTLGIVPAVPTWRVSNGMWTDVSRPSTTLLCNSVDGHALAKCIGMYMS